MGSRHTSVKTSKSVNNWPPDDVLGSEARYLLFSPFGARKPSQSITVPGLSACSTPPHKVRETSREKLDVCVVQRTDLCPQYTEIDQTPFACHVSSVWQPCSTGVGGQREREDIGQQEKKKLPR